jgi:hypothetical protein
MVAKPLVNAMTSLRRVASGPVALVAVLFFVAFSLVLLNLGPVPAVVEDADAPLLDTRFAWDQHDARGFLSALGGEGRRLYALALLIDTLYGLTFPVTGTLVLAWISGRLVTPSNPLRWVMLLPVLAGALDLSENVGILGLLALFPSVPSALGVALGLVTAAKLILVNLTTVLTILGLVVLAVVAMRASSLCAVNIVRCSGDEAHRDRRLDSRRNPRLGRVR